MKRASLGIPILVVCAVLIPVMAWAQKVRIGYDRDINFSKYRTFAWKDGQPAPNPLTHKRIVNAIEGQLASRGWTKIDASPSAVVVYYAAIGEQRQLNAWGSGPRWSGHGTVKIETILTGQLIVDVYDAASKQLIWRGFVSDTVSDKPEKNAKLLNDAVAKLFKQFPPARDSKTSH